MASSEQTVQTSTPSQSFTVQNFEDSHGDPVYDLTELDYEDFTVEEIIRYLLTYIKEHQ